MGFEPRLFSEKFSIVQKLLELSTLQSGKQKSLSNINSVSILQIELIAEQLTLSCFLNGLMKIYRCVKKLNKLRMKFLKLVWVFNIVVIVYHLY